jgi:hypothetical protein
MAQKFIEVHVGLQNWPNNQFTTLSLQVFLSVRVKICLRFSSEK